MEYLEILVPYSLKTSTKRCLFCNFICNPKKIIPSLAYKKDYLLMKMDSSMEVPCPNSPKCSFIGTHLQVDKHVEKFCDYQSIICICNKMGERCLIQSDIHRVQCPFYRQCEICQATIFMEKMKSHLQFQHSMELCNICKKPTTFSMLTHLETECMYRTIRCDYCSKFFSVKDYTDHILDHAIEAKHRIQILHEILEAEEKKFQSIIDDCTFLTR